MRDFVESRVDPATTSHGVWPARYYGRSNEDVGDLDNVDDPRNGFLVANQNLYDAAIWAIMKVCVFHSRVPVHTLTP